MLVLVLIGLLMSIACSLFVLSAGILSSRINRQVQESDLSEHQEPFSKNHTAIQAVE